MFLLDTNVVSELRKVRTGHADANVAAWAAGVAAQALYLSVVSVLEIEIGILRLQRRDTAQAALLTGWLERQVLPAFAGRLLAVDLRVVRRAARLHVPDPRADRDALIAATAQVHGMSVVTRNSADFVGAGVGLINPWSAG